MQLGFFLTSTSLFGIQLIILSKCFSTQTFMTKCILIYTVLRVSFVHATTTLSQHILGYCAQVHGSKPGKEAVEVVLVDEEAVGTANAVGCGAKVLRGSSRLENIPPPPPHTGLTMTMVLQKMLEYYRGHLVDDIKKGRLVNSICSVKERSAQFYYFTSSHEVVLSIGIWCLTRWTGAADGRKICEDDLIFTRASPSPCCCCPVGLGFT
uniref:Uncharacterized protein n=1 Tax=Solanum lycopersicum TaxID=4081 RepID=K4BAT1_SOLLC